MATRELRISHRLTSNHICHLPSTIHHSRLLSALPACLSASLLPIRSRNTTSTWYRRQMCTKSVGLRDLSVYNCTSKLYCLILSDDLKISYELETVKYLEKRLKFCSKRYFLNVLPRRKEFRIRESCFICEFETN